MAVVPVICDECGAIWGSTNFIGGDGNVRELHLEGNKIRGCPECGGWGSVPDGTYNLIDGALEVVRSADLPAPTLRSLIELLESLAAGEVSEKEVLETVEAEAPDLLDTIKSYLSKPATVAWLGLLLTILRMSTEPSPPSAEEVANAIWAKDHPARVAAPSSPPKPSKSRPRVKRPPKTHGKAKQRKSRKRR